ncbi:MAG: hypothetical protein ACI4DP_00540 [Candidatus Ornithomonoglobus sp.]
MDNIEMLEKKKSRWYICCFISLSVLVIGIIAEVVLMEITENTNASGTQAVIDITDTVCAAVMMIAAWFIISSAVGVLINSIKLGRVKRRLQKLRREKEEPLIRAEKAERSRQSILEVLENAGFERPDPGLAAFYTYDWWKFYMYCAANCELMFGLGCVASEEYDGSCDYVMFDSKNGAIWYVVRRSRVGIPEFPIYAGKQISAGLAAMLDNAVHEA